MKKTLTALSIILTLVAPSFAAVKTAKPALRTFNLHIEGEKRPGEIVCYINEDDVGEALQFKVLETGKGTIQIPANAKTFTANYGGVKSRRVDIPTKKTSHTIVIKVDEAAAGGAMKLAGEDRYKITVVVVKDKP